MGYRIEYLPKQKLCRKNQRHNLIPGFTAVCFLLFILLVNCLWPRGSSVLRGLLFSGDTVVAAAALEELSAELRDGQPVYTALQNFCGKIIGAVGFDTY